jgi:hypothetical protein
MSKKQETRARFKVGDWVSFPYGIRQAVAKIIEDRGLIGVRKRRYYRIELPIQDSEADRFEVPEDEMAAATAPKNGSKSP